MGKKSIANGAVVGADVDTIVVLTPSATVALDSSLGGIFTLVPAQNATINASNVTNGERMNLVVTTSGTSTYTLTFGTGFKTTGTLATGTTDAKVFVIAFVAVAGVWTEVSRTTAQ